MTVEYKWIVLACERFVNALPGAERLPVFAASEQETAIEVALRLARSWRWPGRRSFREGLEPIVASASPAAGLTTEDVLRREG